MTPERKAQMAAWQAKNRDKVRAWQRGSPRRALRALPAEPSADQNERFTGTWAESAEAYLDERKKAAK